MGGGRGGGSGGGGGGGGGSGGGRGGADDGIDDILFPDSLGMESGMGNEADEEAGSY